MLFRSSFDRSFAGTQFSRKPVPLADSSASAWKMARGPVRVVSRGGGSSFRMAFGEGAGVVPVDPEVLV